MPSVLKNGEMIRVNNNWKGRNYDSAIIVAPITIDASNTGNAKTKYLTAVINQYSDTSNEYYVHDLIMLDQDYIKNQACP